MSVSSETIESDDHHHSNEINDEPLDPRIQIELERANAATSEINNLETQLDNAQKSFQVTFNNCKQRLATLAQRLGRCVERARPYYNACKQAAEAQLETQKAAQEYQNSVELYHTAQDNLILADSLSSEIDPITRQEYINHAVMKVTQAEEDKKRCEQIHEEKSKLYQEYEQQRITFSRSSKRTINKSKIYFDEKVNAENELQKQKVRIEDVEKAIGQAKQTYRTALNNLEQISEEIHFKRQNQIHIKLPPREPGVGAEKPDEFIEFPNLELTEFPKLDLSEDSSDNELSNSMLSISIKPNDQKNPDDMTSRNLTSNFLEFRNRAARDRNFHHDDKSNDDRTALIQNEDEEVVQFENNSPPSWMDSQRRIQLQFDQVRSRMKKLQQLHDKHLRRPDFDENSSEEKEIESITKDITTMLNGCHTSVQQISGQATKSQTNSYDKRLSSNVVQATASALQDLTIKFRKCQSTYLHQLKSRKDNFNRIMPDLEIDMNSNPFGDQNDPDKNFDQISLTSEDQLQLTSQNVEFLEKRDKEIREVLKSIEDVNEIFRDVAALISNQGTILDQIEYNIENTVVQLEQGNKHLAKAVEHKQRGLKFKLIVFGVCLAVFLFIILVGVLTR